MKPSPKQLNQKLPVKTNNIVKRNPIHSFSVHPDFKELIWIENGPKKNFFKDKKENTVFEIGGYKIKIGLLGQAEPSLIDMNLEIREPRQSSLVSKLGYYPSYKTLEPEQKYKYWQFLEDPYQTSVDIGNVFILYYGLERHLFKHDIESVVNVLIKLRDTHKNSSFQFYSGNAIVLSCILHQRPDLMQKYLQSLDKDYKRDFSTELYLLGLYSFDLLFQAEDLMRLPKSFKFNKTNYIKGYPDLFKKTLEDMIYQTYSSSYVILKDFVPKLDPLSEKKMPLFANMSLIDESISIPNILSSTKLLKAMNELLDKTHESVKVQLAEMRKNKVVPTKQKVIKTRPELKFDIKEERRLLSELEKNENNPVGKHFTYIFLQDFYYKYRNLDSKYLNECIHYCYEDLESLDQLNEGYVKENLSRYNQFKHLYSKEQVTKEINRIKKEKFIGNIPAFRRLAIIYEKKKEFDQALIISKQAIKYYRKQGLDTSDFKKRIERIEKRM